MKPCDQEVWDYGKFVALIANANSDDVEEWCKDVSEWAGKTDWHYVAGRARILTMGDPEVVRKLIQRQMPVMYDLPKEEFKFSWTSVLEAMKWI